MSDLKLEAHRKHEKRRNDTGPRTVRKRRLPVCGLWIDYKQKHVVCSKSGSGPLHASFMLE